MIVVYTDGSRDDKGCTGAGWILYQKQQTSLNTIVNGSCNLGLRSEVFHAELRAVCESLTYLISSSLKPSQIARYMYALIVHPQLTFLSIIYMGSKEKIGPKMLPRY
jgi:ribonuclease HI